MGTLDKEIDSIEKEIEFKKAEIERLKLLQIEFPDIEKTINRSKVIRYSSELVNSIAADCEIYDSCTCCTDSTVKISPYIQSKFGRIYSKPTAFSIGENCHDGGCRESLSWKEQLIEAKIPQIIINKAKQYFRDNMSYDDMQELLNEFQVDKYESMQNEVNKLRGDKNE